ncbi:ATP-binding protein [Chitinophaga sp. 22321]|uniref:ATP-binding protein n=1 Tax=Chitinophaga hostae TaxID=2831022 RepID=A0ABS5ISX5_9BACT|nr:ATP-binding protein [Chitinophaga hostae]MBS0026058.1 ATP-binding protein [Chitinophaga hostae]
MSDENNENENETENHELTEDATPDPEFLITSIAEQGYTLETSLADLIDNSITAEATEVEILIDTSSEPFVLFLADNGNGMSEDVLKKNMKFPSSSVTHARNTDDLGRFGLGMKTASFSQTRAFTVISREKGSQQFSARTWDVEYLKKEKRWLVIRNTKEEIDSLVEQYCHLSKGFLNDYNNYIPNTIVVWKGLYKFENYLDNNKQAALQKEITEITSEYLSLVFHRYLEGQINPLKIRINNNRISPFNPFPSNQPDFRRLETSQKQFRTDSLKIEGYILPARSIDESKSGNTEWTLPNKSLMDMEGIYIYRANRIILYGGWNGIIKRSPRLQLARLKVDIGNSIDDYFHLNVAKSSIVIPYELRMAFLRYVSVLKSNAEKEYFNRGIKDISTEGKKKTTESLFLRTPSSKGMLLKLNENFAIIELLKKELTAEQLNLFRLLLRMINASVNKIRQVHEDDNLILTDNNSSLSELTVSILALRQAGIKPEYIKNNVLPALGVRIDTIPPRILEMLN